MFTKLRHEIEGDVSGRDERLSESQKSNGVIFSVDDTDDGTFAVYRKGPGLAGSVSLGVIGDSIKAIDAIGAEIMVATIGMNDNGRCMLRVPKADSSGRITGYCEIETWRFRKKTMESLFFWY
jgi:hypothetical protein